MTRDPTHSHIIIGPAGCVKENCDAGVQAFVVQNQGRLPAYVRDAWEWNDPKAAAAAAATPGQEQRKSAGAAKKGSLDFSELADLLVGNKVRCEQDAWFLAGRLKGRGDLRLFNVLGACPSVADTVAKVLRATNPEMIRNGTLQLKPDFPLDSFVAPGEVHQHIAEWLAGGWEKWVLILSGPGGLGKTEYACALMAAVAPGGWHFINRLDRIKDLFARHCQINTSKHMFTYLWPRKVSGCLRGF